MEALARQGDPEAIAELSNLPTLPELVAHLWAIFQDLSALRGSNGFGPSRISRFEIRLWEEDEGVKLEPWERRTIMAIDAVYIRLNAEAAAADANSAKEGRSS